MKPIYKTIYLDNAATTPLSPRVLEAMIPYLTACGNPSSAHALGREARRAVERARDQVARAICAQNNEIYFTSGGTESDNWAIKGTVLARRGKGGHVITSAIEHHAVLNTCRFLEQRGCRVTRLPVDGYGRVDPDDVGRAISEDTVLISIMAANNEIGTIEPIREIGHVARGRGVLFHVDAVQAIGSLPVDVDDWGADLLSLSAHKFRGPQGVGALYVRRGAVPENLLHGGEQERGRRGGTINTAGVVGLGQAIEDAARDLETHSARIRELRDMLLQGILSECPGACLNGHPMDRLPGNVNVSFPGVDQEALLTRLDLKGICASGGSACAAGSLEPSHVIAALGVPWERVVSAIRFSIGTTNTREEIDAVLSTLPEAIRAAGTHYREA